jgi:hypothetical protein
MEKAKVVSMSFLFFLFSSSLIHFFCPRANYKLATNFEKDALLVVEVR